CSSHVEFMKTSKGKLPNKPLKLDDFKLGEVIGKGGFGVVYKALWDGRKDVAIKKLASTNRSSLLSKEVENHQKLAHDHIVEFYGYFHDNNEDYIVMELCSEGSIRDYVKRNGPLNLDDALYVLRQLVGAIEYLHKSKICHRDLTAGNVLIKRIREDGRLGIKMCDFGLAKAMGAMKGAHTVAGTPGYMDPHVVRRDKYGNEVDLYSLGCVLYMMLTGREPKEDSNQKRRFPTLSNLEEQAADLILRLTDDDLSKRMGITELKRIATHGFEKSVRSISRDPPTSMHSRRSIENRSRERKSLTSMDQLSIRDRSRSKGPLRERNGSPPAPARVSTNRYRGSSQVRTAERRERTDTRWPLNFDRLEGKREEWNGYRLDIESVKEAVLTDVKEERQEGGKKIMRIRLDSRGQEVGVPNNCRSYTHRWEWFSSLQDLPDPSTYDTAFVLLAKIRWKVAKVIFNNSSFCKGGVIKLMENGDLRVKDEQGVLYNVNANSFTVYRGDPRKQNEKERNERKVKEILDYRKVCHAMESKMEELGMPFPFISYNIEVDSKTATRNAREAMGESKHVSSRLGERNSRCQGMSIEQISRAKSTHSHIRKPASDTVVTHWSAPAGSTRKSERENGRPGYTIIRAVTGGEILGVKDITSGCSLRISKSTANQYIYIDSKRREDRFTFTGSYASLSEERSQLLEKLLELRNGIQKFEKK
ncbi:hypothetical protein PENTCL1PPCAC_18285, partial [Pristionchus entomophagus]